MGKAVFLGESWAVWRYDMFVNILGTGWGSIRSIYFSLN